MFRYNNVSIRLIPHVQALYLIILALMNVLESEHCLLTHQRHLLVGPDFCAVVPFLLNFILQLLDGVLQIVGIILTFLCAFQEELSFFVEFGLHLLLYNDLFLYSFHKTVSEVLYIIDEHLVSVVSFII